VNNLIHIEANEELSHCSPPLAVGCSVMRIKKLLYLPHP